MLRLPKLPHSRFRSSLFLVPLMMPAVGIVLGPLAGERIFADSSVGSAQRAIERKLLAEAAKNVERYRKGDVVIRLVSARGTPIAGAKLSIHQIQHEFLFGCIAFSLVRQRQVDSSLTEYKQRFLDLFNFAVLPFYWAHYESRPGRTNREANLAAARWCLEHGLTVKGHPLVWSNRAGVPPWVRKRPLAEQKRLLQERVRREVGDFANEIRIWDVVNEAVNMRPWDDLKSRDYMQAPLDQIVPYVERSFRTAHAANPSAQLILNEFNLIPKREVRERFFRLVKELQRRNTPISGLGIQAHEPRSEWFPPQAVRATLDRLAQTGLELHITEFIPQSSGKKITGGWRTGVWDQQSQADYAEQVYRLAFGHPNVVSINWWGLSDRHIWQPGGGLLDKNYRPKLVYKRLQRLIHKEWTTDATVSSGPDGTACLRGFYGKYNVAVETPDGTVKSFQCVLRKGQKNTWSLTIDK